MEKALLFSVLAVTSVFADDELAAATQTMNNSSQQQMNNATPMMNVVTLTSARPESENGWYLFADALYWHAGIGSTDWAIVDTVNGVVDNAQNHSLNYKWNWGFRVGIGANINHDMWDTNFYYTWLFADASNSAGKGGTSFVKDQMGIADGLGANVNSGETKWDLHFSMFDWEVGRAFYVSRGLALRPHAGIKGGWINQSMHTKFTTKVPREFINQKLKNDFWGVGPSVGVNTTWVLANAGDLNQHRFSMVGDAAGALMYGHFDITNNQTQTNSQNATLFDHHSKGLSRNLAVPMLQTLFGLSWDTSFNQDKCHFMFKIGYEFQYWFRQFQQVVVTASASTSGTNNRRISDDLSLQGVTAEFRFDF